MSYGQVVYSLHANCRQLSRCVLQVGVMLQLSCSCSSCPLFVDARSGQRCLYAEAVPKRSLAAGRTHSCSLHTAHLAPACQAPPRWRPCQQQEVNSLPFKLTVQAEARTSTVCDRNTSAEPARPPQRDAHVPAPARGQGAHAHKQV